LVFAALPGEKLEFATANLGTSLLRELRVASKLIAAVAYFNPDDSVLSALKEVPKLKLLVTADFQFNNPYKLESLCRKGVWVRAVPVDAISGKLHSKVFYIQRRDGTRWAMVGSANLTRSGLVSNQEACLVMDSGQQGDDVHLSQIKAWLDDICDEDYPEIDFDLAKAIYETRARIKLVPVKSRSASAESPTAVGYWALKPGWGGEYWQNFLAENVISLGWGEMSGNPATMSPAAVEKSYRATWPDDSDGTVNINVAQILKFTQSMGLGDVVLICGRFDGTPLGKARDVFIYGIARTIEIDGQSFVDDKKSSWFRFKRRASIQRIELGIPRETIAKALDKGAFVPTIQSIDRKGFERLAKVLHAEFGVPINV
jgi:HKD family nuclease